MPNPFWIRAVVWLAVIFAAATALVRGLTIDTTTLAIVGGEVSAIGVALALFDRVLWRVPPFRSLPWSGRPPRLAGTWRMHYTIEEGEPRSPTVVGQGESFVVISQTSSQISVQTLYPDGRSNSRRASIVQEDDHPILWFFYDFLPESKLSRIGGARLRILLKPTELDGVYWNELGERGKFKSLGFCPSSHSTFERAQAARYAPAS